MSIRDFLTVRRSERLKRKAYKAMIAAYGAAFERNASGIVDLLTSPAPVIVLDPAQLDEVVRRAVAEALADSAPTEQEFEEAPPPVAVYAAPVEAWPELEQPSEPEQPIVEPPRESSIFVEPVGNGNPTAQPVQPIPVGTADEKRRAFIRDFLREERAARGLIPSN